MRQIITSLALIALVPLLASCKPSVNHSVRLKSTDIVWCGLDFSLTFGIASRDGDAPIYGSFILYLQGEDIDGVLNKSARNRVFDDVHGLEVDWEAKPPALIMVDPHSKVVLNLEEAAREELREYVAGERANFEPILRMILDTNAGEVRSFFKISEDQIPGSKA